MTRGDLRYSCVASAASFSIVATSSEDVSHEPPMQPTFGSARYEGAEATVIPPVGQNLSEGNGPAIDFRNATPPDASAGKNFSAVSPRSASFIASDTVLAPGRNGSPVSKHASRPASVQPGVTRNFAPASAACFACSGAVTVPAPMT